MKEVLQNTFITSYKKYIDISTDYCILKDSKEYDGLNSHKEAFLYAITKFSKNWDLDIVYYDNKIKATEIKTKDFFTDKMYYRYFLEQPFGKPSQRLDESDNIYHEVYTMQDMNYLNSLLFPNGIDDLIIYEWNPYAFPYFEMGIEWWGTISVSIYDKSMDRYIIICSSTSD